MMGSNYGDLLCIACRHHFFFHGADSYHGIENKEKSTARTQNKGRGCPATEKQEAEGPCSST